MNDTLLADRNIRQNKNGTFYAMISRHRGDGPRTWNSPSFPTIEEARAARDAYEAAHPRAPAGLMRGVKLGPRHGSVWLSADGCVVIAVHRPAAHVVKLASGPVRALRAAVDALTIRRVESPTGRFRQTEPGRWVPEMRASDPLSKRHAAAVVWKRLLHAKLRGVAGVQLV